MAVFKSEKFKSLRVSGAGKFENGSLEVTGAAADKVRRLVGNEDFGITEEKSTGRTTKATNTKAKDDADAKTADADPDATKKDDATE